jgi:uncharacterized membrane protein YkvA (DUF1232 family)
MPVKLPPLFERFKRLASKILGNPQKLLEEVAKAEEKADKRQDLIHGILEDLKLLFRMVRAWVDGGYKEIPTQTLVMIVGAILYFVSPVDAIPDWILAIGYLDDAAVVAWVLRSVKGDIDAFRLWESRRPKGPSSNTVPA